MKSENSPGFCLCFLRFAGQSCLGCFPEMNRCEEFSREGWRSNREGEEAERMEEVGTGEQQGLVFLEKPSCFWQRLHRETPEHQKISLHAFSQTY